MSLALPPTACFHHGGRGAGQGREENEGRGEERPGCYPEGKGVQRDDLPERFRVAKV